MTLVRAENCRRITAFSILDQKTATLTNGNLKHKLTVMVQDLFEEQLQLALVSIIGNLKLCQVIIWLWVL